MSSKNNFFLKLLLASAFYLFTVNDAFAQPILEPWGNMAGIRIDGQLMKVESRLIVIKKDSSVAATGKERQRPHFFRQGNEQIVTTNIDSLYFKEIVADAGNGNAKVTIHTTSKRDEELQGIYFTFLLNEKDYLKGSVKINDSNAVQLPGKDLNQYFETAAKTIEFLSKKQQLKISFSEPVSLRIKSYQSKDSRGLQLFIPMHTGSMKKGDSLVTSFLLKASGIIDHSPVRLTLNTAKTGRTFIGFGGNFRLQNPKTDPQVIDYCLKNLDVRFSRVEMPWQLWQPELNEDPIAEAKAGKLNAHVRKSMEMAQRLYQMHIPVILSAWSAPAWAVVGKPKYGPDSSGVWGNPLDSTKANEVYKSIADYIVYLKEKYGVEVRLFSFNESDLGINVRQTGEEHDALIKGLGAYFVSRGLKTKMLLGDNSDATTFDFIKPALNDPETYPFIGAISFHSWRGWDKETLEKWAQAATQIKRPLIVAEGSIDAQAWGYPAIFEEPEYALNEINLYVRLLSICEPEAILQWQLTADYSLLAGGGIFGDTSSLRPTQRFWNMKQFSSTPEGLKAMEINYSDPNVSVAALGDNQKNIYAIHLVNNGASRKVILTGIPRSVKSFKVFVTGKNQSMKEEKSISVSNGKAEFILKETAFTSLFDR
jgi:O-glycosyl hydrolase